MVITVIKTWFYLQNQCLLYWFCPSHFFMTVPFLGSPVFYYLGRSRKFISGLNLRIPVLVKIDYTVYDLATIASQRALSA